MANVSTARQSNTDSTVQEPGGYSGHTAGISGGNTAIRKSVAMTQGGTYSQSAVKSVTNNLRYAYVVPDCDSPPNQR